MTKYLYTLITAVSILCTNLHGQESPNIEDKSHSVYALIDNLQLNKARKQIRDNFSSHNDIAQRVILENYADFIEVFIGEDKNRFHQLEKQKQQRLSLLNQLQNKNPWKAFAQSSIHLQWAFTRIKFGEYFSAVIEINKAFKLLNKNAEKHPRFAPNYVGLGLLHTMIGSIPPSYQSFLSLITSLEGSIPLGKKELNMVRSNDKGKWDVWYPHLRTEALFFLTFIEVNLSPERKLLPALIKECITLPDSRLKTFFLANLYMKNYENDKAIQLIGDYTTSIKMDNEYPFFFLYYMYGEALLRKQSPKSKDALLYFVEKTKGRHYIKSAYRMLAWNELIQGKEEIYIEYMAKIKLYGDELIDSDKQALKAAKRNTLPSVVLLKSRLSFDGGYFSKALADLSKFEKSNISKRDLLEMHYRKARIQQEQYHYEEAIACFKKTIEMAKKHPWYFAGKSALELGKIYESKQQVDNAIYYYQMCLDLTFNEYKTSIKQKAKAGLNRLK